METLIHDLPLPVVGVALVIAFVLASLLGNRLWRPADGRAQADIGYVVSGALGLLALLIGFTFAVALDRYATRRDLVVREANAIEAAWLRTDLLTTTDGAPLRAMLRDYAVSRLRFYDAGTDAALLATAHAEADRRQSVIWKEVRRIVATEPSQVAVRGLVDTTGEVIQVAALREAAARANIPPAVIRTLLIYATLACLILGYALGGAPRRHRYVGCALFVLLALAVSIILDLDRPRRGAIRVSQQPMTDLLKRIDLDTAAVVPPA